MTTTQHTLGPWWPSQNTAGAWCVLTYRDHQTPDEAGALASAYGASICSNIGDHTEQRTRGNEAANARLIAAAPDLLAALELIDSHLTRCINFSDVNPELRKRLEDQQNNARAAIAKATGQPAP